nr:copper resistance protein B [Allosphingosinicella vermicomposti]
MPAQSDPHAGHAQPAPATQADPHAGHVMPTTTTQSDPHAGHDMSTMEVPAPPKAPPSAAAMSGPAHAADLVFGSDAMEQARAGLAEEHGSIETFKFLLDRGEVKIRNGSEGYLWDAQAWYGGDIDKLWVKSEGEGSFGGDFEEAEVQALWSRAIDPWFDLQVGVRQDFQSGPDRTHLVLGVQGLAPYWFEVDGAVFVSNKGDVTARLEGEYDLRITQKLILQPRLELELAMQDVPELGIGSGISSGELGARLRYEIVPEFAPYVGVEYERAFGDTARFAADEGEGRDAFSFLVGLRAWF